MMRLLAVIIWILVIGLSVLGWAIAAVVGPKLGVSTDVILQLYQNNARTPIFTGFLTMGSLLLAMKSTILVRLKEGYDTEKYYSTYRKAKARGHKGNFYAPLERLAKALGWNILFCLTTSLLQLTVGFWYSPFGFALAAGPAAACLLVLMFVTLQIMRAHEDWFVRIEDEAQKRLNPTQGSD